MTTTKKSRERLLDEFYDKNTTIEMKLARIFEVLLELRGAAFPPVVDKINPDEFHPLDFNR